MEVIVDDTNILIDLANMGLLSRCKEVDISFHTTDMAIEELRNNRQRDFVLQFIACGGLTVDEIRNNDLIEVALTYQQYTSVSNISLADVSVMILAERLGCRLLTNDQKLKLQARQRGIQVNGLLWLTDLLVEHRIVSPLEMIDYLQKLLATNGRSPRPLILERIEKYTNTIKERIINGRGL